MSKIKILALGGMGENGKNMYVVDVDNQLFVFDAGLIYPEIDLYGIDAVIPNIDFLIQNKDRIAGIFISHGHEDHIGALPYLLQKINARVYGMHFTISLIEQLLELNKMPLSNYKLYRINDAKTLKFGNVSVSFYNVNHSIPEAAGIVLKTEDGAIVYATDFNFARPINDKYKISYDKLLELSKQKVLAVLAESIGATDTVRSANDQIFDAEISNAVSHSKGNIFVMGYSTDLARIQKIASMAVKTGRKIAIVGRKGEQIVNMTIKTNYLNVDSSSLVSLDEVHENLIVFVVGTYQEPYFLLGQIINNKIKNVRVTENDLLIGLSDPVPGTEVYALRILDEVYKRDLNFLEIEKKKLRTTHATIDDLTQLYAITKPKYYIPIKGEERHLMRHRRLITELGNNPDKIISLSDGNVAIFENGEFKGYEKVPIGKLYVDGTLTGSVDDEIVKERDLLSKVGVIEIVATVDSKQKTIVKEPSVITKGFVYQKFDEKAYELVNTAVDKVLNNSFKKKHFVLEDVEEEVSNEVRKLVLRLIKTEVTIIPIVIDLKNTKYQ